MYVVCVLRDGKPLGTPIESKSNNMLFETFAEARKGAEEYEAEYKEDTAVYALYRVEGPVYKRERGLR